MATENTTNPVLLPVDEYQFDTRFSDSELTPTQTKKNVTSAASKDLFVSISDKSVLIAKSMKDDNVVSLRIDNSLILRNPVALDDFSVQDSQIVPRHNFSKADPGLMNIRVHACSDEPSKGGVSI